MKPRTRRTKPHPVGAVGCLTIDTGTPTHMGPAELPKFIRDTLRLFLLVNQSTLIATSLSTCSPRQVVECMRTREYMCFADGGLKSNISNVD